MAAGSAVIVHVQGYPAQAGGRPAPAHVPFILADLLIIAGLALIYQHRQNRSAVRAQPWVQRLPELDTRGVGNVLLTLAATLFYILCSEFLGFLLTSFIVMCTLMGMLKAKITLAAPVAAAATLVIYLIFNKGLLVPLPRGLLHF
jgi:putative tricarboxylic transport membrane protein